MEIKEFFSKNLHRKKLVAAVLNIISVAIGLLALVYKGPAKATLNDIRSIKDLQSIFNQDKDLPRIILLMSPT
jgi:hypothetical protein